MKRLPWNARHLIKRTLLNSLFGCLKSLLASFQAIKSKGTEKVPPFFNIILKGEEEKKRFKINPPVILFCNHRVGITKNTKNRQSESSACKSMACLLKCLDLVVKLLWFSIFQTCALQMEWIGLVILLLWKPLYSKPFWEWWWFKGQSNFSKAPSDFKRLNWYLKMGKGILFFFLTTKLKF